MKDKKTILLIAVLLALIGVYVWHSGRLKKTELPKAPVAAKKAPLDPRKAMATKVLKAINAHKKEKGSVPRNLEELKGKYLDDATYQQVKKSAIEYVYVNPQAYRLSTTASGAKPVVVAAKKPTSAAGPATTKPGSSSKIPVTTQTGWQYNPSGKPDPFKPFIIARTVPTQKRKKRTQPLTPLQKMPLSEIQTGLKAIIWGQMGARALVEDATGKGYVVREGTYVGQNDGIVKKILEDRIVVEEYRRDPIEDRLVTNEVVLKLKKGEGEE